MVVKQILLLYRVFDFTLDVLPVFSLGYIIVNFIVYYVHNLTKLTYAFSL